MTIGISMFMIYQTISILIRNPHPSGFGGSAIDAAIVINRIFVGRSILLMTIGISMFMIYQTISILIRNPHKYRYSLINHEH